MACPHMSGIAALAISKFGSSTFTAEELKQRILSGVKPIDLRNYNESKYTNKLGIGYADAALTLEEYEITHLPLFHNLYQVKLKVVVLLSSQE